MFRPVSGLVSKWLHVKKSHVSSCKYFYFEKNNNAIILVEPTNAATGWWLQTVVC